MKSPTEQYKHTETGDVMSGEAVKFSDSDHLNQYYLQGKDAKQKGKPISACPYAPNSIRGGYWEKGYCEG
jgi:hypothetical protein